MSRESSIFLKFPMPIPKCDAMAVWICIAFDLSSNNTYCPPRSGQRKLLGEKEAKFAQARGITSLVLEWAVFMIRNPAFAWSRSWERTSLSLQSYKYYWTLLLIFFLHQDLHTLSFWYLYFLLYIRHEKAQYVKALQRHELHAIERDQPPRLEHRKQ